MPWDGFKKWVESTLFQDRWFKYHGNVQFPVAFRAPKLLLGVVAPVIAATQGWHARGVVVPVIAAKKDEMMFPLVCPSCS